MLYPIDVNYLIALIAGCFAFGVFTIYQILSKVQVKLELMNILQPNKNYGTIDIVERGGNVFTFIASYSVKEYKRGKKTFIFPINQFIARRWGRPYTAFVFNDGAEQLDPTKQLMTLKDPDAKPADLDYGKYINFDVQTRPKSSDPESITNYLLEMRDLDKDANLADLGKPQGTSIFMWILLALIFIGVVVCAYFAYNSSDAATFTAKAMSTVYNLTK